MAEPYQPDRGHFAYLDFTPQAGTEQAGRRPALILSPRNYNIASGLAFACPVTNQGKGSPFEVQIPAGVGVTGFVLSDHLRSIDWIARRATYQANAPQSLIDEVVARIEAIILQP